MNPFDKVTLDLNRNINELEAENAALRAEVEFVTNARIQDAKDAAANCKQFNDSLRQQLAEANEERSWIRRKLNLAEDTKLLSGEITLAGTMHKVCSAAHGYRTYIETEKCDDKAGMIARLTVQLASTQLEAKRLREALEDCDKVERFSFMLKAHIDKALSSPTSTEALDAYVADKVKELQNELERERMRLAACGTAALGYFEGCCDEYKSASLDDTLRLYAKAEQITRQRDLAVSAIENLVKQKGRHNTEIAYKKLVDVLAAIKESGATK